MCHFCQSAHYHRYHVVLSTNRQTTQEIYPYRLPLLPRYRQRSQESCLPCPLWFALLAHGAFPHCLLDLLLNAFPMEPSTYHTLRLAFSQVASIMILLYHKFLESLRYKNLRSCVKVSLRLIVGRGRSPLSFQFSIEQLLLLPPRQRYPFLRLQSMDAVA